MRWPRCVVGRQALEFAFRLHHLGVRGHDLGGLAMERQRDLLRLVGKALARRRYAAHDEFEVRIVVAVFRPDHQEVALAVGAAVQAMRAIEHEDLVGGDAMALDELRNLADVRRIHRRKVVAVVDVEASLR